MPDYKSIGKPMKILDGRAKVTGAARYTADLDTPGLLHARLVTSLYAHANLRGIDGAAALKVPGVAAVLTAADLPDIKPTSRMKLLLARGRVMFAGQPIAMVLGETESAAADGAALVQVDYEPLPASITPEAAKAENAPLVWPGGVPKAGSEAAAHGADTGSASKKGPANSNIAERTHYGRGDVEAGFSQAAVIVEGSFTTPMVHQSSIETQSTTAAPDLLNGGVRLWASTQSTFTVRHEVAAALDLPESLVHVAAATVGGGFGGKNGLYEPLVAAAAMAVGTAVRLTLTRSEELLAGNPAPPAKVTARLGASADGTLTALSASVEADDGCYPSGWAGWLAYMMGSFYRVPNLELNGIDIMTHKPSAGPYRAPCGPTAVFAIDTLMDELAQKLGRDTLELRLQNAARTGDPMADGKLWPNQGMVPVLEALQRHPAWRERAQARAAGRGVGLAIGGWPGGIEPAAAMCSLNREGELQINVGSVDINGTSTAFTLMAAEIFGLAPEQVRVIAGDTDNAPYSGASAGSKITYTTGAAVVAAAQEARRQVLAVASQMLEAAVEDLDIVDGAVQVKGVPSKAIQLKDLAKETMDFESKYPPVYASGRSAQTATASAFDAQLAEVEVDRETGEVRLHRLLVVQDVGRAINPAAINGQLMGGAMQGVGWALGEQMSYDADGQLLSGTFMDYAMPDFTDAPTVFETELVEVPSDDGPFGVRGVGEAPVVPTAAAIANAIADAAGVRLRDLPMSAPRVLAALSEAPNGAAGPRPG
jgi:CO/xanthine dehydrogenase Mo-binding subunit